MSIDHIHALPPGTRFEEYRLDAVLGAGGFGITYRAYDANLNVYVAIKEYLPGEFATRTEASTVVPKSSTDAQDYQWGLSRFLDEARTLARFNHPHLNRVHRFFEANGTAYMVLEYIEGETLAARLGREPRLPEDALLRLLEEVLSGLAVIHEAGYVHRDIKPGNLMLRAEDGSAVVLDFGAARQAVGQRSKSITSILTPGYAPIEQYDSKAEDVGPWSDIYALGMVAYKCISGTGDGELPDAVTRGRTQRKGGADLASAAEAGKGRYSKALLEAVDWAIEVDEEARPQEVAAWSEALGGGSRKKGQRKTVRKPATRPEKAAARTGMSWSSMALVVVIVALLGASAWQGWRLYREMPQVGEDGTIVAAEPQTGAKAGGQTGDTEASTQPDGAAETDAPMPDAGGEAAVAGDAGTTDSTQPATPPPPEQDTVARLLAGAEADLAARRLTSPVGNNAWEKYQRILGLSPAHPGAIAGMERVIGSYLELFGAAMEQEDFDKADTYLARIRELHPDSPLLEEGAQRLQAAQQAQAEREAAEAARLAEQERQRQAEEAARQAELERQRIAESVAAQWEAFELALRDKDFDAAANAVEQVRNLDPEEPGLVEGERRLAAGRQAEAEARAVVEEVVADMVYIPGGRFQMGRVGEVRPGLPFCKSDNDVTGACPVHTVTVRPFKLGKYEVTFAQWDACVADGGCQYKPVDEGWGRGNRPVINVSWDDVQSFIGWLNHKTGGNYRLPSEAEWEYAARAGSTTAYPWGSGLETDHRGNDIVLRNWANCLNDNDECADSYEHTAPVGSFPANAWGLHDMHGNVTEWVQDCEHDSYVGAPSDGSAWTRGDCSWRVYRGGAWDDGMVMLQSDTRMDMAQNYRTKSFGFRLAQDN